MVSESLCVEYISVIWFITEYYIRIWWVDWVGEGDAKIKGLVRSQNLSVCNT